MEKLISFRINYPLLVLYIIFLILRRELATWCYFRTLLEFQGSSFIQLRAVKTISRPQIFNNNRSKCVGTFAPPTHKSASRPLINFALPKQIIISPMYTAAQKILRDVWLLSTPSPSEQQIICWLAIITIISTDYERYIIWGVLDFSTQPFWSESRRAVGAAHDNYKYSM